MAKTERKKKRKLPWNAFVAERLALYSAAAANKDNNNYPNWAKWYKMIEPILKREVLKKS